MAKFKFAYRDDGNYRVYYKRGRYLYCIQNDGSWGRDNYQWYACSRDGEPCCELSKPPALKDMDRYVLPDSCANN